MPDIININGQVTFAPSSLGWHIWEKHYRDLHIDPPNHGESLTMEIWLMANIFGDSLYNGGKLPFKSTEMAYKMG
jgi:hypothetical protein